jgi:hypothetical protein
MSEVTKLKRKLKSAKLYEKINESHALAMLESQTKLKMLYPYERIKGQGYGFFINAETKEMVKITLGKQIYRMTENPDKHGKHLVMIDNQTVLVPQELIEELGYN